MRPSKIPAIVGWILSILIVAMLAGPSAMSKLTEWEGKAAAFEKLGFTVDVMYKIGLVEVGIAVLFLIPRTSFIAAILIAGYLGGATCAHVRVGEPFVPPVVIGVLTWVALGLRTPGLFRLAFGGSVPTPPAG
jgi:hypothetical protein